MPDQQITCRDCGAAFAFSEGEQEFYASRGLASPQRCKACRANRKNDRMGPKQMHPATCGKCGAACEVPFKPRPVEEGGRPVLCKACFDAERGSRMS
jgi:CxxC-x17-CxxC domain-containing protein